MTNLHWVVLVASYFTLMFAVESHLNAFFPQSKEHVVNELNDFKHIAQNLAVIEIKALFVRQVHPYISV